MKKVLPKIVSLVDDEKNNFIIYGELNNSPYIISPFSILDNIPQPSLIVDINRQQRAKNLLKAMPAVFKLTCNGKKIKIDAVHKNITINLNNIFGLIHYKVLNTNQFEYKLESIYKKHIDEEPIYFVVNDNDETTFEINTLKIFPILLNEGCIISINDSIEKVLYLVISNKTTGLIGTTTIEHYKNCKSIISLWPELDLYTEIDNNSGLIKIHSKLLKNKIRYNNCYIKLHKNFGGNEIICSIEYRSITE